MPEFNVPEGWKLVPVEPSVAMLKAASDARCDHLNTPSMTVHESASRVWNAMLAASPTQPVPAPGARTQKCEICGDTNNLRRSPLMRRSDPPVVCLACVSAWYDGGATTPEEILKARGIEPFAAPTAQPAPEGVQALWEAKADELAETAPVRTTPPQFMVLRAMFLEAMHFAAKSSPAVREPMTEERMDELIGAYNGGWNRSGYQRTVSINARSLLQMLRAIEAEVSNPQEVKA